MNDFAECANFQYEIHKLGHRVDVMKMTQHIPADVLVDFYDTLKALDGMNVRNLDLDQSKLVEMVVDLGNECLISDVLRHPEKYEGMVLGPELQRIYIRRESKQLIVDWMTFIPRIMQLVFEQSMTRMVDMFPISSPRE